MLTKLGGFQTFPAGYIHSFGYKESESEVQNAQMLYKIHKNSISSFPIFYLLIRSGGWPFKRPRWFLTVRVQTVWPLRNRMKKEIEIV